MARYLVLWRRSPTAWPTDPVEYSNLVMKIGPLVDNSIKKGEIIEHGHFLDGTSGYSIFEDSPLSGFICACACCSKKWNKVF